MLIALAADHGGFILKETVKEHLTKRGIEWRDLGTKSEDSVDYPYYGKICGEEVAAGRADRGIVFCGTGVGISISANKVPGVRCALCTNVFMAEMASRHNNANLLALGGRVLSPEQAIPIVDAWLDNVFEGGRHERRVNAISDIEKEKAGAR
ncbi:MAG TPA: ribose 5-phosphate isomerase B [Clostridiales bacterium]|jgi:ribose 5-phosphate isomerase B|nr:ribose 5-phosphate isomerase B [Clostridiales bacterium]